MVDRPRAAPGRRAGGEWPAVAGRRAVRPAGAPGTALGFLLHDIGKVAIPDAILRKPDKLTEQERAQMAQHPAIGSEIVRGGSSISSACSRRAERLRGRAERARPVATLDVRAGHLLEDLQHRRRRR